MPCHIDLVLVFRALSPLPAHHFSKQRAKKDAQDAEDQYTRLLSTLHKAGLHAVGRRGEHQGQLILLVSCSAHQLRRLLQRERQDTSFAYTLFLYLNPVTSTAIQTFCTAFQPVLLISIRALSVLPNAYVSCTSMSQPLPQTEALASTQKTTYGLV
jgi:hypothetical protein